MKRTTCRIEVNIGGNWRPLLETYGSRPAVAKALIRFADAHYGSRAYRAVCEQTGAVLCECAGRPNPTVCTKTEEGVGGR